MSQIFKLIAFFCFLNEKGYWIVSLICPNAASSGQGGGWDMGATMVNNSDKAAQ